MKVGGQLLKVSSFLDLGGWPQIMRLSSKKFHLLNNFSSTGVVSQCERIVLLYFQNFDCISI